MPFDYKKLNLLALGGTLLYAGYLLGSIERDESIITAVNSAYTNSDEDRSHLRAASPSASWDTRLTNSASWDIGAGEDDEDDAVVVQSKPVVKHESPKFAKGPVINQRGGKASTINLIGERHSGTNWITDHLVDCFGDQIQVSLCRLGTHLVSSAHILYAL